MDFQSAKEHIKDQIPLAEVVARYTKLQPAGAKLKGLSPFTKEKTPSFFVDPDRNLFYCFSSQRGGDIFSFIQAMEGLSFSEALQFIAKEYAIDVSGYGARQRDASAALHQIGEDAIVLYRHHMTEEILGYLKGRGITQESVNQWEIGYAPAGWDTAKTYLMKKGHSPDLLKQSGLVGVSNGRIYDRFRDRIMFPLRMRGKCIGFAGRLSPTNATEQGKYINVPETLLYKKRRYCYGMDRAAPAMRKNNFVILTEGYLDVILMHHIGFAATVASSGTAVTKEHMRAVSRYTRNVVLAFDGDIAGVAAARRAAEQAFSIGLEVNIALCPEGKDPADIAANNPEQMKSIIADARPAIRCFIELSNSHTPRAEIYETLFPLISAMQDPIQKDLELKRIADTFGISKESIRQAYTEYAAQKERVPTPVYYSASNVSPPSVPYEKKCFARAMNAHTYLSQSGVDTSQYTKDIEELCETEHQTGYVYTGDLQFDEMFSDQGPAQRAESVRQLLEDSLREFFKLFCNRKITELAKNQDNPEVSEEKRRNYEREQQRYLHRLQSLMT